MKIKKTNRGEWRLFDDGLAIVESASLDYVIGYGDALVFSRDDDAKRRWGETVESVLRKDYLGIPF